VKNCFLFSRRGAAQVRVERAKERRAAAAQEEAAAAAAAGGEEAGGKKLGRGALQREKKRKREEAGEAGGKGGKGGNAGAKGGGKADKAGGSKVRWGEAKVERGEGSRDLSKPYREKGNKMEGVVRAGAGRRTTIDPRGAAAAKKGTAAKGQRNGGTAVVASGDKQLAKLVSDVGDVMPKAKKARGGGKDKPDDFDRLVKQYNSSLFKAEGGQGARWFD
jgi:hypothetical protein